MLNVRRSHTGKTSIIGHRGAAGCAPENTLAAFSAGLAQGADIIELDVQLCADGQVVAMHDDTLDRTTDGHGPLARYTLAELKRLDAGSWFAPRFVGERIPALDEVLAWAKGRVPLFIELKPGATSHRLAAAVLRQLVDRRMADDVMLISFDHRALRYLRDQTASLALGMLYRAPEQDPIDMARRLGANFVMPWWGLATPALAAACHAAGLGLSVWGDDADYAALLAAGVDCMNADYPAQVRRDFLC